MQGGLVKTLTQDAFASEGQVFQNTDTLIPVEGRTFSDASADGARV
jgi:hypothetical protein